ncbi:hypothetical protein IDJ77_11125 [Mucilaginibacter sp. ZT4R22]|uniref:Right handed beta helix domain-containing protein n=1 Tax=Mucilaginibacter pankratovii TaxID=2772110 RepID=A0ABR7WPW4_9SPHI|nr:right-handed parallel beta-helix repeat-containing protein [Mucilaginibacter pankratovii]MBD1364361.1 hypothetical protein [Mucilaginibacter pankratovii]
MSKLNVKQCGAKGDGKTDDTEAIIYAIRNADSVIIPTGIYIVSRRLHFSGLSNKNIIATGAVIKNTDITTGTLQFENGKNIKVTGGMWTRTKIPVKEGKGEEHTFTFIKISNLTVQDVTINGSPQMGIALIDVIEGYISHNKIINCYRDGIYAHYSVKLTYINNYLENIKDDALSIHDYGLAAQKQAIIKAGYLQAGQSKVLNNVAVNVYQGFASIGCDNITVANNNFSNTVNAGIAIANAETLFKGGTARASNIVIKNNVLKYNGGSQTIMNVSYNNYGQLTTGRSALFVGVRDSENLINNPKSRIKNITITGNAISGSFVNGAYIAQVDNMVFQNNTFTNCNTDNSVYCGKIVEINSSTKCAIAGNTVTDNRAIKHHLIGYELRNVSGTTKGWAVNGYLSRANSLVGLQTAFK